jgi:hypothetical protein
MGCGFESQVFSKIFPEWIPKFVQAICVVPEYSRVSENLLISLNVVWFDGAYSGLKLPQSWLFSG